MKRLLNDEDHLDMEEDCNNRVNSLALRVADLEGESPSTLAARMSAAESGISSLGLILPAVRYVIKQARLYLRQNLQDHVEIGQMVSRKNGTNEY